MSALLGSIAASRVLGGPPPKTTWLHWGVEFRSGTSGSAETLRVRGMQWNLTSGVHNQDLPAANRIHAEVGPSSNSLTDLYTNSSVYCQWLNSTMPADALLKVWGTFPTATTIKAMGIYAQTSSLYWPDSIRFIWSDDAVTWYSGDEILTPAWVTSNYTWFNTGF